MDYGKEFKEFATKHHGINSMYLDKIVSSMTPYIIEERQLERGSDGCFFEIDDGQDYVFGNGDQR